MSSMSRPPESMDSLLFLCVRHVIAWRPLRALPASLYPVLFKAAFLDRRSLVLWDLVATWPFKELHFQRLVGEQELLRDHTRIGCVQAIIQAVMAHLQWELEEPSRDSRLRVLDMTRLHDSAFGCSSFSLISWSTTEALAKACVEMSKHQQEFKRHGSRHRKGYSRAATGAAAPLPLGVDVHTDLVVKKRSYKILRDALHNGATGPLRLKCREFEAEELSASKVVTLLESLDPSCVRRVHLCDIHLELSELHVILPHLWRFPELRSIKFEDDTWETPRLTPELTIRLRCTARHLGMLPCLRELHLRSSQLSGNLHQILGDLQAPLESLRLNFCVLLPDDLAFLSQSFHAPALKILDLSQEEIHQDLLEALLLLLEKASASLLHLNLVHSEMDDSHLDVLLPTLLRCSRLRFLGLGSNSLSTAALKNLLQKTLELPDLHLVVYPIPGDCYKPEDPWKIKVDEDCFAAAKAEFSQMLADSGRINLVWTHDASDHRDLDYFSL